MSLGSERTFSLSSGELLVVCEGRSILVSLPPDVPFDALAGRQVTMRVSGVMDYVGNVQAQPAFWAFKAADLALQEAKVTLAGLAVPVVEGHGDDPGAYLAAHLPGELAEVLMVDADQFNVVDPSYAASLVKFDLEVLGSDTETPTALAARVLARLQAALADDNCDPANVLCTVTSLPELKVEASTMPNQAASGSAVSCSSDSDVATLRVLAVTALVLLALILILQLVTFISSRRNSGRVAFAPTSAPSRDFVVHNSAYGMDDSTM